MVESLNGLMGSALRLVAREWPSMPLTPASPESKIMSRLPSLRNSKGRGDFPRECTNEDE